MPESCKEVFSLRMFREQPYKKIGRLNGKSRNWTRATFYRTKLQIIEHMETIDHERD